MNRLLAIDPGNTRSGWALIDPDTCRPEQVGLTANDDLRALLLRRPRLITPGGRVVIEQVKSYGMPVGSEVFDTCVWIGRFTEIVGPARVELLDRQTVRLHHCHDTKAKDINVRRAMIDRFAPGVRNSGRGTLAEPGWFAGFTGDIWQAYALGVAVIDRLPITTDPAAHRGGRGRPASPHKGR